MKVCSYTREFLKEHTRKVRPRLRTVKAVAIIKLKKSPPRHESIRIEREVECSNAIDHKRSDR